MLNVNILSQLLCLYILIFFYIKQEKEGRTNPMKRNIICITIYLLLIIAGFEPNISLLIFSLIACFYMASHWLYLMLVLIHICAYIYYH